MRRADVPRNGCPPHAFFKETRVFGRRGFTLVEVVVTMGIVAVALVALVASFMSGLILVESGRDMAIAGADARAAWEEIRRTADQGLASVVRTNWTVWAQGAGLSSLENESVSVVFRDPSADPLEATVTVRWTERERPRSAAFTGLVTQR